MAFGAFFRNNNKETVIDENFKTLQILREMTATNVVSSHTWPGDDTTYGFQIGRQSTNSVIFAKVPNGRAFGMLPSNRNRVYSNWNDPINLMEVALSDTLPAPSGYGMAVYAANGDLVFNSNYPLLGAGSVYETPTWTVSGRPSWDVTDPGEWVMIATPGAYRHYVKTEVASGYPARIGMIGAKKVSGGYTYAVMPIKTEYTGSPTSGATDRWFGTKGYFVTAR